MKKTYKELYGLVQKIPGYTKGEQGEKLIQGLIWQHTKERTYKKSELTDSEYASLCDWIRKNYGVRKRIVKPGDEEIDKWRKRVIAVICDWIDLSNRESRSKVSLAKSIAEQSCRDPDRKEPDKQFNELTEFELTTVYNIFLKKNKIIINSNRL
ncbi:MAG: hypothetical protein ACRC77_11320 [Bacteroidales bacterium]